MGKANIDEQGKNCQCLHTKADGAQYDSVLAIIPTGDQSILLIYT